MYLYIHDKSGGSLVFRINTTVDAVLIFSLFQVEGFHSGCATV